MWKDEFDDWKCSHIFTKKITNEFKRFNIVNVFLQFEKLSVEIPHVGYILEFHEVGLETQELCVGLVIIEWNYGHSIGNLKTKRIGCIVDEKHVAQMAIPQHPKSLTPMYLKSFT